MIEPYIHELIYLLVGMVAGLMNTLAGGGSMFIMGILLAQGIPSNVANSTNSLGILLQNLTGTYTFHKSGFLDVKTALRMALPAVMGAIIGTILATAVPTLLLDLIVGILMMFALVLMVKPPKNTAKLQAKLKALPKGVGKWVEMGIFLLAGFQAGFMQAGMGVVLIIVLSMITSLSIIRINAIKMVIIGLFTIPVFVIFALSDLLLWPTAIALAVGQVTGTWLTSKYLLKSKGVALWANRLVIVVVLISLIRLAMKYIAA